MLAAGLEAAINAVLALDEKSASRMAQLDGRLVKLELEGLGIDLWFSFSQHRVQVSLEADVEADTVINGTPAALFAMAVPDEDGHWGAPGSRVTISGDATLARDLERLFSQLDPDWEGRLADWLGDVAAYQLASGTRIAAKQVTQTVATLEDMAAEFLHRTGSPLAQEEELFEFGRAVDQVRDATERLEARLRVLAEGQSEGRKPTAPKPRSRRRKDAKT